MTTPVVPDPSLTEKPPESGIQISDEAKAREARDNAILAKLREQDETIKAQNAKIEELSKKPEVPIGDQNKEFWNNPVGALDKALKDTVAPLIEFRNEFKATETYNRIKNEAKNDARLKDFLAQPGVEQQMDQLMAKNPTPTHESFGATLMGLRGAMELGVVPKPVTTEPLKKADEPPKPPIDMTTLPPHLRPSAPPARTGANDAPKLRELNENERRLARERHLSDADYIELTDNVKPLGVVEWKSEAEKAKEKAGAK